MEEWTQNDWIGIIIFFTAYIIFLIVLGKLAGLPLEDE